MSQTAQTPVTSEASAFVSLDNLKPFAKIVFGDGAHEVARCGDDTTLAYRPEGTSDWQSLGMILEDGWPRIGGGIILSRPDALARFVRTHVVRIEGNYGPSDPVPYALDDLSWLVRDTADPRTVDIKVGDEDWATVTIGEMPKEKMKDRAVAALIKAQPDLELEVSADMIGWAERLGAGAQILPVM